MKYSFGVFELAYLNRWASIHTELWAIEKFAKYGYTTHFFAIAKVIAITKRSMWMDPKKHFLSGNKLPGKKKKAIFNLLWILSATYSLVALTVSFFHSQLHSIRKISTRINILGWCDSLSWLQNILWTIIPSFEWFLAAGCCDFMFQKFSVFRSCDVDPKELPWRKTWIQAHNSAIHEATSKGVPGFCLV